MVIVHMFRACNQLGIFRVVGGVSPLQCDSEHYLEVSQCHAGCDASFSAEYSMPDSYGVRVLSTQYCRLPLGYPVPSCIFHAENNFHALLKIPESFYSIRRINADLLVLTTSRYQNGQIVSFSFRVVSFLFWGIFLQRKLPHTVCDGRRSASS